ncbi:unnamed protein product [Rotaria sp. Silwood1]|nr:unnamed protein product [Rotaria sp. Silwood1]
MEVVQIAPYESDILDEEMVKEDRGISGNKKILKKKKSKYCVKKDAFDHAGEAEASIGNQWSKYYTNYAEDGRKVYYRCKKAKLLGPQCAANIYLSYHADSDKVQKQQYL